jgi:hypothetical protein
MGRNWNRYMPKEAMPWLRRLAAGFAPRRPGLEPGSDHVGFVVDKVTLGGRFSPSTSVSAANSNSTDYSTLVIYHLGTPLQEIKKNYILKTDHASSSKLRTWKLVGRCSGRCSVRPSAGILSSLENSSRLPSVPGGKCLNNTSIEPRQPLPSDDFKFISHWPSYHSKLCSLNTESVVKYITT